MKISCITLLAGLFLASCTDRPAQAPLPAPTGTTPKATSSVYTLAGPAAPLDSFIPAALREGNIPGAVVLIGRGDQTLYHKAFGERLVEPQRLPMTQETVFDLASLTKPIATATSIMILAERGKITLTDPVAKYIPAFAASGKAAVTVEQLLLHRGGLPADTAISDYAGNRDVIVQQLFAAPLAAPPGSRFIYSDVGYQVLGELVRIVDGRPLDQFFAAEIAGPLGMAHTRFNPPAEWQRDMAGTEHLLGRVHDPRGAAMGGVAGHAGLFGTAADLARFCRMLCRGGELDGHRILQPQTVAAMLANRGGRTYGFDCDTGYSWPRGQRFSHGVTVGHTGFTGVMLWLDPRPSSGAFYILLTSRLHPDGKGNNRALGYGVATLAAEAALPDANLEPVTLTGIDNAVRDGFSALRGRRIGLITNHTGVDRLGRRTVDLIAAAPGVKLVALFSPEHGIAGALDREGIGHTTDAATGLPIYSLYGETKRPTDAMLNGVDTLVFDIQDVGTRFYTYIATMKYAMEEAAKRKIRFIVLDRPNPLGGTLVDGPLADADKLSFVACAPIPVVHGMTIGELARLFQQDTPTLDLAIVPLNGWTRSTPWEQTGCRWINPSPNMRNITEARLYPAIGLLEMTNISVGRGTETPFEVIGAPWIDSPKLAAALTAAQLPGLRFDPMTFTPDSSKFAAERCNGVRITLTDPATLQPTHTALTIATALRTLHGAQFDSAGILKLLANQQTLTAWQRGADPTKLPEAWAAQLADFRRLREPCLIYK